MFTDARPAYDTTVLTATCPLANRLLIAATELLALLTLKKAKAMTYISYESSLTIVGRADIETCIYDREVI